MKVMDFLHFCQLKVHSEVKMFYQCLYIHNIFFQNFHTKCISLFSKILLIDGLLFCCCIYIVRISKLYQIWKAWKIMKLRQNHCHDQEISFKEQIVFFNFIILLIVCCWQSTLYFYTSWQHQTLERHIALPLI